MRLNNQAFYEYLIENGIHSLYHANTVATSITFIQHGGLLSRGAIESRHLYQTPQESDEIDKTVDVWNDIFFDSTDLHGYFPRQNIYGPVSFKYSSQLVLNEALNFWVTKNDPQYWTADLPMNERYFQSVDDLRENGNNVAPYRKMITIKNYLDPLTFEHLQKINIDNPRVKIFNDVVLRDEYTTAFLSIQPLNLVGKFHIRQVGVDCKQYCYCTDNYLRISSAKLARLFLPHNHPRMVG